MILFYIPCKDKSEARGIGKELISRKLVACVNMFPISSMFFWEGELQEDSEFVLLAKTLEEKKDATKDAIIELHSYDLPAVISMAADVQGEYEDWMRSQLGLHKL